MILRAGKANAGFSLLELILVVSLLGLSSLIVLPAIDRGLKQRQIRHAALELAAVARSLRSRALHEGNPQGLTVNLVRNSYSAARGREVQLPAEAAFSGMEGGEPLDSESKQFLFFPNGSTMGGRIGIASGAHTVYYVRLEPLTGKVEVLSGR